MKIKWLRFRTCGMTAVLCAAVYGTSVRAAQCQGKDGAWYDYASPMCQPTGASNAPASAPSRPAWLEPGAMFGDLDEGYAMTLRGVVLEYGYRCDTVSAVRSCLWGCDWHLDCNAFRYTFEISDRGGRIFVDAQ